MNYALKQHKMLLLIMGCVFIVCIALSVACCMRMRTHLCSANLTYTIDTLFSAAYAQELQESMTSLMKTYGPSHAIKKMCMFYPAVSLVTCAYMPSKRAHVVIHAHDPQLVINNENMVLTDGVLVSKDFFNSEVINTIPHIKVSHTSIVSHILPVSMYTLLSSMPSSLYETYAIEWRDDHVLVLYEKTKDDVVFVCDTESVPDETMLAACHKVAQECRVTPSRKHHLVIDARFANQIIVYGDTGGYGHGSGIG